MMLQAVRAVPTAADIALYHDILPQFRLHPSGEVTAMRITAECTVRRMLAQCTGTPPGAFRFLRTPLGKPYADDAPQFNYSHSGAWLLCAVSETAVGVDIEVPRPVSPRLMRRVCTPDELAYINGDPLRFLQVWTAKEAYCKYLGTGLRTDPRTIQTVRNGTLLPLTKNTQRATTPDYTYTVVFSL